MLVTEYHHELYDTSLLGIDNHSIFKILLRMLQYMVTIGKSELFQVISSVNRFGACLRECWLDLAVYLLYAKTKIHTQIVIYSRPTDLNITNPNFTKLISDFINDYPDTIDTIHPGFPSAFGAFLYITLLVDSDYAHNVYTHWSTTGSIRYIGSTPVIWYSKRQG